MKKYNKYLLIWKDNVIQCDSDIGTYSSYTSGNLEFENNNKVVKLLERKTPMTQNGFCGEYDEEQTKKALCQYHFILSHSDIPKELGLEFINVDDHEKWSSRDTHTGLVSESIFGTYFLENNGRVVFHGDHKDYRVDSKRLIHLPNSTKIKSAYGFTPLDIKKSVCCLHNLELLIKLELGGNPGLWERAENLVKAYEKFKNNTQNKI